MTHPPPLPITERRLTAWRSALSPSADAGRFAQRLRFLGWTEEEALLRLAEGQDQLFDRSFPDLALLYRGLDAFETSELASPSNDVPFGELFPAFVEAAANELAALAGHRFAFLSPVAIATARQALLEDLAEAAAPALCAEVASRTTALLPMAPRREPYEKLVRGLHTGGFRVLLDRLPVLARNLAQILNCWTDGFGEFLTHVEQDTPSLKATFSPDLGTQCITQLSCSLGDAHRQGRRVMSATFACGRRLLYKPRNLQMDVAWHGLLDWLRSRATTCTLRAPLALNCEDHGWVEFVEPGTPDDPAEYYRRAGELLALSWLCGGSDFHEENVVATREGPVLIDLETLFTPIPRPFGATDEELAEVADEDSFAASVLSTLLLPVWQIDERGNVRDLSGLNGSQREGATWHEPRWVDLGTNRIREEMRPAPGKQPHNIPRDREGRLISATPFAAEVAEGFRNAARALLSLRDELPIEAFRGADIRFLVRNTQVYGMMQQRLRRPEFLRSPIDRAIELEKLSRGYFPRTSADPQPSIFACYEAERIGMENGDIPCFHARNDETTLRGDGGVEVRNYFWKTGWELTGEKLRRLDEAGIEEQAALVRSSLELRYRQSDPPPEDWLGAATTIAEELAARALPLRSGGVSWLSLGFDPIRKIQAAGIMGTDLYSGALGVAIFLAALSRVSGEKRWMDLALDCTRERLEQMCMDRHRPFLSVLPVGLGTGLGSMIYGCQLLAGLTGEEAYLDHARHFTTLLHQNDPIGDILGGSAGAIIALLNLGTPEAASKALAYGHSLLAQRVTAPSGHRVWQPDFALRPLTGLGHGAAGFAWALHRLGRETNEPRFQAAAEEALAYERAVFDESHDNWPDFRRGAAKPGEIAFMHGWCAGQPGIGLSRLIEFSGSAEAQPEIDTAIRDARVGRQLSATHLCCGQSARVELLLHAARVRGDATLRADAGQAATVIQEQRRETGIYPLTGADHGRLFAPSFFQGTTGIGYQFLRLVDDTLPSVAVFEV